MLAFSASFAARVQAYDLGSANLLPVLNFDLGIHKKKTDSVKLSLFLVEAM